MKYGVIKILLNALLLSAFGEIEKEYVQSIPGTQEKIAMAFIPGGAFMMGSEKSEQGHFGDEGPQHQVEIDPFWMGKFEITWDLYELFVARNIDGKQPQKLAGDEVNIDVDGVSGATQPYTEMSFGMGVEGYPAICMTQLAAAKFCEWLSAMTGNFYRLPTEAEWNMLAEQEQKRPIHLEMIQQIYIFMGGTKEIVMVPTIKWVKKNQTLGACMICMAMFLNGLWISMFQRFTNLERGKP